MIQTNTLCYRRLLHFPRCVLFEVFLCLSKLTRINNLVDSFENKWFYVDALEITVCLQNSMFITCIFYESLFSVGHQYGYRSVWRATSKNLDNSISSIEKLCIYLCYNYSTLLAVTKMETIIRQWLNLLKEFLEFLWFSRYSLLPTFVRKQKLSHTPSYNGTATDV